MTDIDRFKKGNKRCYRQLWGENNYIVADHFSLRLYSETAACNVLGKGDKIYPLRIRRRKEGFVKSFSHIG